MGTTDDDLMQKFTAILQKSKRLGLSPKDLAKLNSMKSLKTPRITFWGVWYTTTKWISAHSIPISAILSVLLALFVSVSAADWPVMKRTLVDIWFHYYHMSIDREPCLFDSREGIIDFARPPVDCSVCEGIDSVDHVSNLKPEVFEQKYAYSGRPVVIMDGTKSWTAIDEFSFDFFKNIYAEDSPALLNIEQNCQFFPYKTNFHSLGEVFNMSRDRAEMKDGAKPWYIGWSNCDPSAANILRQHYKRPYFLPQVAESSKTDWIFMGSPGYGAHMHIDNVGNPSWQAQIAGRKRWSLEPPPECYHVCEPHIEVTVEPGEIIVVDTNRWFHSTLVLSDDMSITIGSEYD